MKKNLITSISLICFSAFFCTEQASAKPQPAFGGKAISLGDDAISFNNPLVDAADQNNTLMVRSLLRQGMDPNSRGKFETTGLMRAATNGNGEIVKMLIEAGASVSAPDFGGATPLHLAAREGQAQVVALLLANGSDVNARDGEGWTPLMRAATKGNTDVIRTLLVQGAKADATNFLGETALIYAVKRGNVPAAQMLKAAGADPTRKNNAGLAAQDFAAQSGNATLQNLFGTATPDSYIASASPRAIPVPPVNDNADPSMAEINRVINGQGNVPIPQMAANTAPQLPGIPAAIPAPIPVAPIATASAPANSDEVIKARESVERERQELERLKSEVEHIKQGLLNADNSRKETEERSRISLAMLQAEAQNSAKEQAAKLQLESDTKVKEAAEQKKKLEADIAALESKKKVKEQAQAEAAAKKAEQSEVARLKTEMEQIKQQLVTREQERAATAQAAAQVAADNAAKEHEALITKIKQETEERVRQTEAERVRLEAENARLQTEKAKKEQELAAATVVKDALEKQQVQKSEQQSVALIEQQKRAEEQQRLATLETEIRGSQAAAAATAVANENTPEATEGLERELHTQVQQRHTAENTTWPATKESAPEKQSTLAAVGNSLSRIKSRMWQAFESGTDGEKKVAAPVEVSADYPAARDEFLRKQNFNKSGDSASALVDPATASLAAPIEAGANDIAANTDAAAKATLSQPEQVASNAPVNWSEDQMAAKLNELAPGSGAPGQMAATPDIDWWKKQTAGAGDNLTTPPGLSAAEQPAPQAQPKAQAQVQAYQQPQAQPEMAAEQVPAAPEDQNNNSGGSRPWKFITGLLNFNKHDNNAQPQAEQQEQAQAYSYQTPLSQQAPANPNAAPADIVAPPTGMRIEAVTEATPALKAAKKKQAVAAQAKAPAEASPVIAAPAKVAAAKPAVQKAAPAKTEIASAAPVAPAGDQVVYQNPKVEAAPPVAVAPQMDSSSPVVFNADEPKEAPKAAPAKAAKKEDTKKQTAKAEPKKEALPAPVENVNQDVVLAPAGLEKPAAKAPKANAKTAAKVTKPAPGGRQEIPVPVSSIPDLPAVSEVSAAPALPKAPEAAPQEKSAAAPASLESEVKDLFSDDSSVKSAPKAPEAEKAQAAIPPAPLAEDEKPKVAGDIPMIATGDKRDKASVQIAEAVQVPSLTSKTDVNTQVASLDSKVAPEIATSGKFWLRIGQYEDSHKAEDHYSKVTHAHNLHFRDYSIVHATKKGDNGVAIQIGPFSSLEEIADVCKYFAGERLSCSTVVEN